MKYNFYNKINLKKETLDKIYVLVKCDNFYLLPKTTGKFTFFTLSFTNDIPLDIFFIENLKDFEEYQLKFINYFKADENFFSAFFLLEIDKKTEFLSKKFDFFEVLPNKDFFTNSTFYQNLIKKILFLEQKYFIYILRCKNSSLYTGITIDFKKRLKEHEKGTGAKYTKNKGPFVLEALFLVNGRSDASKIEAYIKKLPKSKKEKLLINNQTLLETFPQLKLTSINYPI